MKIYFALIIFYLCAVTFAISSVQAQNPYQTSPLPDNALIVLDLQQPENVRLQLNNGQSFFYTWKGMTIIARLQNGTVKTFTGENVRKFLESK